MRSSEWWALIVLACLVAVPASAETPYLELWAVRAQTYTQEVDDPGGELAWDSGGYWGGEALGRMPLGRVAILLRAGVEGAAGTFVMSKPGTWTRGMVESALAYQVISREGYDLSLFGGAGASLCLSPDREGDVPPKYGFGVHVRHDRKRVWGNARVVWDRALGSRPGIEVSVHTPASERRVALGVNLAFGAVSRAEVQFKALVWSK